MFEMFRNLLNICFFVWSCSCQSFAQNANIDSLNTLLKKEKNDSSRTLVLIDLASNYIGYDTLKCDEALQGAFILLKKHPWDYNRGYYYDIKSQAALFRGNAELSLILEDSALFFYNKALKTPDGKINENARYQIASVTVEKGSSYNTLGRNDEAIKFFLYGLELLEQSKLPEKITAIATCENNIATLYFRMEQYEKGLEYDLRSIPHHLLTKDTENIAYSFIYTASDFTKLEKIDSAKAYLLKAEPYVKKINKPSVNVEYYGHTGNLYAMEQNWSKALTEYTRAYESAEQVNEFFNKAVFSRGIANSWYHMNNSVLAEKFALQSLRITEENNFISEKIKVYQLLSLIYNKEKDWRNAYDYLNKYVKLNDSAKTNELKQKVNELETRYQAEKRQQEISRLEKDKQIQSLTIKHQSTTNYLLLGSLAALLTVGFLGYLNFRTRQQLAKQQHELQQQHIRELEKDKQLMAVDAVLKGQEEERSRMAKDLHDGLGGLLSGVKFTLSSMKGNVILSEENLYLFNSAIAQLDNAMNEMRRVAHNMMPETLIKFGLVQALQDFCEHINETKNIRVNLQTYGLDERINASAEIIVYRIVQELLNNILKHANAKMVLLQLVKQHDLLSITVEDDGKGFDIAMLETNKGAGIENIRSRVDYLKGNMDIQSQPGNGTSVHITCALTSE